MRGDDSATGDGGATSLRLDGPGAGRVLECILTRSKPLQAALAVRRDALASMASVGSRHSELLRSAAAPGTPPASIASVLEAVLEYEKMRREALLGIQDLPPLAACAAPLLASGKARHVDVALQALHKALGRWALRIREVLRSTPHKDVHAEEQQERYGRARSAMLKHCKPGLQALAAGGGDAGRRAAALLDKLGAL